MSTTADLLNKLVSQKNTLADNLVEKGVEATHDETLETLVPKVLDISSGSTEQKGVYPLDSGGYPTGDVIIPEGVVTLNSDSPKLNNNQNVTSIELPSTFREFASSACSYSRSLTDVTIKNDDYVFFGGSVFRECNALTNIHFTNPNTKAAALANLTSAPPIPFLVTAADKSIIKSIAAKAKISFTSSDGSLPAIPVIPSITDK